MHTYLLQDLAIVMAFAGAITLLCHRFKQPVVIGYLLAGLLTGPYTPPFSLVHNLDSIHTMAELGLVFLLFSLGLEFNLPKIRRVGVSVGLAAILEVAGMLGIGYALGLAFGWNRTDSIFLGCILSMSSTTIIVKVFMDFRMMQEKFVHVVFGILVLEDIAAIAILSILSGLGQKGGPDTAIVFSSFLRIGLFIVLFLVIGLSVVPRLMGWVAKFRSKEVMGIVTLGLCLGGAMIAAELELSIALGAFLAGAVLAASKEIGEIEEWIHPVRDMFSALFFVSAGMLIQPHLLWEYKGPIFIITIVTLVGKVLSGGVGSFLAGYDMKTSARVGMSLAQIGEFSFVIASLGLTLNVTSDFLYPLAVMVSSLTTLATPYLIRNSDRIVDAGLAVMPDGLRARLEGYQARMGMVAGRPGSHGTAIFSRYLARLGVYLSVFAAVLVALNAASRHLAANGQAAALTALWTVTGVLMLPLFRAFAKYADHVLLLLVTRSKTILHHIDVHAFYNALNAVTIVLSGTVYVWAASRHVRQPEMLVALAGAMILSGALLRKLVVVGKEWLEGVLDEVLGLATSEPTRQAVMRSGERSVMLVDITDQVTVAAGSFAHDQTIRDMRLREKTGATVVAIYRQGQHLANPEPDLKLEADDVLILLGSEDALAKARRLLVPEEDRRR